METVVRTHVLLHEEAMRALDQLAGPRGRSRLIEELILAEARRRKALAALDKAVGKVSPDSPPEWATPEGTIAWIRALRAESSEHDPWAQ